MEAGQIISLINKVRIDAGLSPLRFNDALKSASESKAKEMKDLDYFAHLNAQNEDVSSLVPKYYKYYLIGENLAFGFKEEEDVLNAWMKSESHRDNILYQDYKDTAVSILPYKNSYLVVQVFGIKQQDYLTNIKQANTFIIHKNASTLNSIFWISAFLFVMVLLLVIKRTFLKQE